MWITKLKADIMDTKTQTPPSGSETQNGNCHENSFFFLQTPFANWPNTGGVLNPLSPASRGRVQTTHKVSGLHLWCDLMWASELYQRSMSLGCHLADTLDAITPGHQPRGKLGDGNFGCSIICLYDISIREKRRGQGSSERCKCQFGIKYSCRNVSQEVL